jgi:hypothetical protein
MLPIEKEILDVAKPIGTAYDWPATETAFRI